MLFRSLESLGEPKIETGVRADELLRRPSMTYATLLSLMDAESDPHLTRAEALTLETDIKYEGYIKKQLAEAARFEKLEKRILPEEIDYSAIRGISLEAAQKLAKFRPHSIGAASRISGISPADISVLLIYLDIVNRGRGCHAEETDDGKE